MNQPRATSTADVEDAAVGPAVIRATGLAHDYGAYRAVAGVDLTVRRGEVFALLGTNGAGKTTTLELLQGYRRRTAGELSVLGVDPQRAQATVRRRTGTMLQEAGLIGELTVRATAQMWASLSSRTDDVDAVLDRVGLAHRGDVGVQAISGGERRRLDLALAIWGAPELVILDEPTTGLDPASRQTLWDIVRQLRDDGTTILLTTHHLEEAESLADRVAIMHAGRIAVAGTLNEVLLARPATIRAELDLNTLPTTWWPDLPPTGAEVSLTGDPHAASGRGRLVITCTDLQTTLLWLLQEAALARVPLDMLRATPASLEDVFHAVRTGALASADEDETVPATMGDQA